MACFDVVASDIFNLCYIPTAPITEGNNLAANVVTGSVTSCDQIALFLSSSYS